jgi:hypothetical protein
MAAGTMAGQEPTPPCPPCQSVTPTLPLALPSPTYLPTTPDIAISPQGSLDTTQLQLRTRRSLSKHATPLWRLAGQDYERLDAATETRPMHHVAFSPLHPLSLSSILTGIHPSRPSTLYSAAARHVDTRCRDPVAVCALPFFATRPIACIQTQRHLAAHVATANPACIATHAAAHQNLWTYTKPV